MNFAPNAVTGDCCGAGPRQLYDGNLLMGIVLRTRSKNPGIGHGGCSVISETVQLWNCEFVINTGRRKPGVSLEGVGRHQRARWIRLPKRTVKPVPSDLH